MDYRSVGKHNVHVPRRPKPFVRATATLTGLATAATLGNVVLQTAPAHADGSGISWDAVAQCESGGNWNISTGNGYLGGLQWTRSTWAANGGVGNPANASREQQITVAENLVAKQGVARGLQNWPVCGKKAFTAPPSTVTATGPKHAAPARPAVPLPAAPVAPRHAAPDVKVPAGPTVDYTVAAGDTLSALADGHQVAGGWPVLAALNGLADPDALSVGQQLKLPAADAPAPVSASGETPVMPIYTAGVINTTGAAISGITGKPITLPRSAPVVTAPVAPSAFTQPGAKPAPAHTAASVGAAAKALSAAIGQTGTRYVYGGAAPGGFDCSGLIMWAFKQAGISLPRTAAAQSTVGRPVNLNELRPGDLLFFYRPVDHVVMYVGDGKIVEASQPGVPVHVRPLYLNGFVGARRLL